MKTHPHFSIKLAESEAELQAAQRLRYQVFVQELGGDGPLVDHEAKIEIDAFDGVCQHLLLLDLTRNGSPSQQVVGVYRVMTDIGARARGGFYSASEFDLSPLLNSGRHLMEMGRTCLHPDYRGGGAMMALWQGLSDLVQDSGAEILFGVASFHGTDLQLFRQSLSHLHHTHLISETIRPVSLDHSVQSYLPAERIDKIAALRATPALIKAYLRLGGGIGQGAFVDHVFNTTDVCMVLDTTRMNPKTKAIYQKVRSA